MSIMGPGHTCDDPDCMGKRIYSIAAKDHGGNTVAVFELFVHSQEEARELLKKDAQAYASLEVLEIKERDK